MQISTKFNTNKNLLLDNIGLLLVMFFVFTLPYEMHYSSIALALLAVFVIFLLVTKQTRHSIPKQFWIFQIAYLLALSGYLYSSDVFRANYILERQLTIFLFPLLLPLVVTLTKRNISFILCSLCVSCVLALVYLYYCAFNSIYANHLPLKAIISDDYVHHKFSFPLDIHAGYLSMYISLSIFFIIKYLSNSHNPLLIILSLLSLIFFFTGLFSLASRNIIITTGFIVLFVYPFFCIKRKAVYLTVACTMCALVVLILSRSAYFKERFSADIFQEIKMERVKLKDEYSVEPRMQRWICAVDLIKQQPIWGHGTGDEVGLLKAEYYKKQLMVSYRLEFNAHNEYLSVWLKHGIIGLLLFIFSFAYYSYLAIKDRNFIYTSFLLLLLVGFCTENILDMNKGIFYFAFFNTLFGYSILFSRKKEEKHAVILSNEAN